MYDELIKRLYQRIALTTAGSPLQDDLRQAADAIEELSAIRDEQKAQIIAVAAEDKPRWIPVTERLPGDKQYVIIFSKVDGVSEALAFESATTGEIMFLDPIEEYFEFQEVTHWMPLPQPPKEET